MLIKQDLKTIRGIMTDALGDFFKNVLAPYLDAEHKQNREEHREIKEHLQRHDKEMAIMQAEFDNVHRKLDKNQTQQNEIVDPHGLTPVAP